MKDGVLDGFVAEPAAGDFAADGVLAVEQDDDWVFNLPLEGVVVGFEDEREAGLQEPLLGFEGFVEVVGHWDEMGKAEWACGRE